LAQLEDIAKVSVRGPPKIRLKIDHRFACFGRALETLQEGGVCVNSLVDGHTD
jgi:hypothetical protein